MLAVVGVVIQAGTMTPAGHRRGPAERRSSADVGIPLILTQFVGFVIFMVAAQAELTQPPFDMPVAESEIVVGAYTEYTGWFAFFLCREFGGIVAFAGVAATLFLGGWAVPRLPGTAADCRARSCCSPRSFALSFLDRSGCASPTRGSARTSCSASRGSADPDRAGQHPRRRRS